MPSQPETVDLIVQASWIIPVVPARQVLEQHVLVVHQGRVLELLPADIARIRYRAKIERRLDGHALLPGLVNAHTHAAMSLLRGYSDDLPLMRWLEEKIWPAEARWVSPEFVTDGTHLAIAEMLSGGTTCFSDMYFFPDCVAAAVSDTGIRAQLAFPIFETASAWGHDAQDYISRGLQLRDDYRLSTRLSFAFGPHAAYSNSNDTLKHIALLSEQIDVPVHIHLQETGSEINDSLKTHGQRPLMRLADLGLVNSRLQAVHMTQMDDDDLRLLAENGARLVHCPASNLKLASGRCPVERLIEHQIPFAIGTDGAASNNGLDMLAEVRLAALLAKGGSGDPTQLDAHSALAAATLGGARVLGLDDRIGTLEPGKDADFIAVDLRGIATSPVHDPVSQLVYTGNSAMVSDCWVQGRALLQEGQLTSLNTQQLTANATRWRDRLAGTNDLQESAI